MTKEAKRERGRKNSVGLCDRADRRKSLAESHFKVGGIVFMAITVRVDEPYFSK